MVWVVSRLCYVEVFVQATTSIPSPCGQGALRECQCYYLISSFLVVAAMVISSFLVAAVRVTSSLLVVVAI